MFDRLWAMDLFAEALLAIMACATVGSGCRTFEARHPNRRLERELQSTLDAFLATNPAIPGVALHVTMLSTVPANLSGPAVDGPPRRDLEECGMSILVREVDGLRVYSHTGYWGTLAAYVPELDLAIGISVTQQKAREPRDLLLRSVLGLVTDRKNPSSKPEMMGQVP